MVTNMEKEVITKKDSKGNEISNHRKSFVLNLATCYWMDLTADVYFRK